MQTILEGLMREAGIEEWGVCRYEDALPLLGKVKLLGIRRSVTDYAGEPQAADVIGAGNSLILYGSQPEINDLIQRGEVSLRRGT